MAREALTFVVEATHVAMEIGVDEIDLAQLVRSRHLGTWIHDYMKIKYTIWDSRCGDVGLRK
jgi:hypothetical protein